MRSLRNTAMMRNTRLWVSLCVVAVMVAALLTGAYSVVIEPELTNVVTAIRTTEGSTYSEKTSLYVWRSMEVTTVRTVTTSLTTWLYKDCRSGYIFYPSITLIKTYYDDLGYEHHLTLAFKNLCVLGNVEHFYPAARTARHETNTYYSLSTATTLTLTSTSLSRSLVEFPVTVTESHYETLPNPEKINLQRLTVVLFIAGLGGIALAIILRRPLVSAPVAEGNGEMTMYCIHCGATIPRDSVFCKKCGRRQV